MKLHFTLFLLCFYYISRSQLSYSFSPSKTVSSIAPLNETTEIKIDITNTSNSKLVLNWFRISNTLPNTWQYTTCDNAFCYGGVPSGTKTMDTIPIGGQSFLKLGVEPGNDLGSGQVKIYTYQDGFPNNGDTLIWNVVSQAVGIEEISDNSGVSIYPNPTNHFLNITLNNQLLAHTTSLSITNTLGEIIRTIKLDNQESIIDISNLSAGYYNLVIETPEKKLFKKIIKSN